MIVVLDEAQADLAGSELRCPDCPGQLRRWGFARTRSLRCAGGGRVSLRPRRVRCAGCRVTHVLLTALAPPHRAYAIDVVGQALLASASGRSHRTIGPDWASPPTRCATGSGESGHAPSGCASKAPSRPNGLDPMLPAIVSAGSALADAVSALATAAAVMVRRLGPLAPSWHVPPSALYVATERDPPIII